MKQEDVGKVIDRSFNAQSFIDTHARRITDHYLHAREKHPYFCDTMLPFCDGFSMRNQKQAYACAVKSSRDSIVADIHNGTLPWDELLNCEMWEALDALINGDTAHAVEELYDCVAVLLRTIDVIEGRQKLGKPKEIIPHQ